MKAPAFEYHAPTSIDEAVSTLVSYSGDAKLLAGGQSLIPLLNLRLSAPGALVDLRRIDDLRQLDEDGGWLVMGAMTTHSEALASDVVLRRLPILAEALRSVGHPAIRNAGTVGGSLAHADPAAELPLLATLLGAEVVVRGPAGIRRIGADSLFRGFLTTALESSDVLTHVRWPLPVLRPSERMGWGFREVSRRHGDFCIAAAAAVLRMDAKGAVTEARVALGGVGDRPLRVRSAEDILTAGRPADGAPFAEGAEAATNAVAPSDDIHASAEYRRHLAGVLTRRVLEDAARRASEVRSS